MLDTDKCLKKTTKGRKKSVKYIWGEKWGEVRVQVEMG